MKAGKTSDLFLKKSISYQAYNHVIIQRQIKNTLVT